VDRASDFQTEEGVEIKEHYTTEEYQEIEGKDIFNI